MKQKAVFLDRDGVINEDNPNYVWRVDDFHILPRVVEAIQRLKQAGYVLIVVTNQSGIAKGLYHKTDVLNCWDYLQEACGGVIDAHYFAPHHPLYDTASLARKPDSLMLEKAIAKFNLDRAQCWLVGDSERDIIAAGKQQIRSIKVRTGKNETSPTRADLFAEDLYHASELIVLGNEK